MRRFGAIDLLATAEELGVEHARLVAKEGARDGVRGDFRGRRIWLHREQLGSDAELRSVRADLDPALDLGLDTGPRPLAPTFPSDDFGHVHLDQEYQLAVDEPRRAHALLRGDLANAIYALHCACESPRITDCFVEIHEWSPAALTGVVRIADLVNRARSSVAAAGRVAHHLAAWTELAARVGATVTTTPLRVSVAWNDLLVEARAPRLGRREHELELSLRLPTSLDAGISILPTRPVVDALGVLFGGQDLIVGESTFDEAFRIRVGSERAEALKGALDLGTRALLLGARERGASIAIGDDGIRATFDVDAPPEALPSTVEPLAEALRRLERRMRLGDRAESPYRA